MEGKGGWEDGLGEKKWGKKLGEMGVGGLVEVHECHGVACGGSGRCFGGGKRLVWHWVWWCGSGDARKC
jgi:hypothetical protein